MYISLYDLGLFILFMLIVIAGGYLIAVLHRAFCVLGTVREILQTHNTDIAELLSELPKAVRNVSELSISVKNTVHQASSALAPLQIGFIDTIEELREGLATFRLYGKIIGRVFRVLFSKS